MSKILSKITGGATEKLFTAEVLGKHQVDYHRCVETGFIQTSPVHWLDEAYSEAITSLDLGLLLRNQELVSICRFIIDRNFRSDSVFVDYAGGYGAFTRMMRDQGYQFFHHDKFCENLFAKNFDVTKVAPTRRYELLTAFEVFEHFDDPIASINEMCGFSDNIFFSTILVPDDLKLKSAEDWWYFAPETGQHIAFYTRDALAEIARQIGMHFHTNGRNLHLFTKDGLSGNPFKSFESPSLRDYAEASIKLLNPRKIKCILRAAAREPQTPRSSLLEKDFQFARSLAKSSSE